MPRSSGGGSSSGGSRSGSSHRSSSYRSSSGRSGRIMSTRPEPGLNRYRYYDKHGREKYIYCNYDPADSAKASKFRWLMLLFYLPFFGAMFMMFSEAIFIPKTLDNHNGEIIIEDTIDVIKDEESLKMKLSEFYEETGVTPAVVTVSDDMWNSYDNDMYYLDLESYAYSKYTTMFKDEMHWLVVYSESQDESMANVNWSFEGMIGEDTEPSISYDLCDIFTRNMQYNLENMEPEEAIGTTFTDLLDERVTAVSYEELFVAVPVSAFIILHAALMLGSLGSGKKYKNAVLDEVSSSTNNYANLMNNYANSVNSYQNHNVSSSQRKKSSDKCPICGAEIDMEQLVCPFCGNSILL